jgi:hypothetical protein
MPKASKHTMCVDVELLQTGTDRCSQESQVIAPTANATATIGNGDTAPVKPKTKSRKRSLDADEPEKVLPPETAMKKLKQSLAASYRSSDEPAPEQPPRKRSQSPDIEFEDVTAETNRRVQEAHERRKAKRAAEVGNVSPIRDESKRKRESTESLRSVDSGIVMATTERARIKPAKKRLRVTEQGLKKEVKAKVEAESKTRLIKGKGKRPTEDEAEDAEDDEDGTPKAKKVKRGHISVNAPSIWVEEPVESESQDHRLTAET